MNQIIKDILDYIDTLNFDTNDNCYKQIVHLTNEIGIITYTKDDINTSIPDELKDYAYQVFIVKANEDVIDLDHIIFCPIEVISKLSNETRKFVILHEIGHIFYDAKREPTPKMHPYFYESCADRFAVEILDINKKVAKKYLNEMFNAILNNQQLKGLERIKTLFTYQSQLQYRINMIL